MDKRLNDFFRTDDKKSPLAQRSFNPIFGKAEDRLYTPQRPDQILKQPN